VAGGPSLYRNVYEKLQMKGLYDPAHPFTHVVENRHGVITVTEDGRVYGGGAYDGVFLVDPIHDRNAIFRVLAMGAMRPNVRSALMIGLASGSWARVVEAFPALQHLTIIEINPGYLDLIRRFPGGNELLDSPKVEIVIDDGRRWLHRNPHARFDTIISNTTWNWRSNITNLLSREFLRMVRGHLEPGGLFFYNTTWSDTVEKTAISVFPYGYRVMNCLAVSDAPIQFDKERWRQFMEPFQLEGHRLFDRRKPDEDAALDRLLAMADDLNGPDAREGFETHQHLLQRMPDEPILTDDNMLTEW
jgi:spermidine synthase